MRNATIIPRRKATVIAFFVSSSLIIYNLLGGISTSKSHNFRRFVRTIQPHTPSPRSGKIPKTKERVAICLSGNVRAFSLKYVYESILDKLINPLESDYHVDIFFNVKLNDEPKGDRMTFTPNRTIFHSILSRKFRPVVLNELEDNDDYVPNKTTYNDENRRLLNKPNYCVDGYYTTIYTPNSLFRYQQCGKLIRDYERRKLLYYDYIYTLRPDIWFNDSFKHPKDMQNNTLYINMTPELIGRAFREQYARLYQADNNSIPHTSDHIMAGDRRVMNVAMDAADFVDNCETYSLYHSLLPENTLLFWALKNHIVVHSDPLLISVVRYLEGVGCSQFNTFYHANESYKNYLTETCFKYEPDLKDERELPL